jgi:uncharacterized membrane protein
LLAAVLHAGYILLGRGGWGEVGDGAAAFLIVATGAAGLGALTAATRPSTMVAPVTHFSLTGLLLFEGALAGAAAPLLFLAGLRRIGATQTAVLSLCEPLTATVLAAVMLRQLPAPTQLLGAGLLVGAGIAVQIVPARPGRAAVRELGASAVNERPAGDVGEHCGHRAGAVGGEEGRGVRHFGEPGRAVRSHRHADLRSAQDHVFGGLGRLGIRKAHHAERIEQPQAASQDRNEKCHL